MALIPNITSFSSLGREGELLVLCVSPDDLKAKRGAAAKSGSPALYDLEADFGIIAQLRREDFKASAGSLASFRLRHKNKYVPVVCFGWEKKKSSFEALYAYRELGNLIISQAKQYKVKSVALSGHNLNLQEISSLGALIEGALLGAYEFTNYKSGNKKEKFRLPKITILSNRRIKRSACEAANAIAQGTLHARDLVNMPPNDCTPSYLKRYAQGLAKRSRLKLQIFDRKKLQAMKAGSLLSVSKGTDEPPYLLKLTYRPKLKRPKVISIIGKGITFDTGGYSIKTGAGMMTMKCDMSGAAAVLGAIEAIAAMKPNCEVRAYIPTTENMINGSATRPGDIVRASNGKTIEILNTDAEGRLILADALVLAEKDKANAIIDLATLTGACVAALGDDYAGLFTDDEDLAKKLGSAAELSSERIWRLPLAPEYKDQIKSPVADIKNIGGGNGGAITAALFLKEFVKDTPWAHLDIAGPAFVGGDKSFIKKGGTGFGVRTLVNFVIAFT